MYYVFYYYCSVANLKSIGRDPRSLIIARTNGMTIENKITKTVATRINDLKQKTPENQNFCST